MSFSNLGLRAELINAITEKGYSSATPIQSKAIPAILEGRDVLGGAQTGTGKTAAFALPILQNLSESGPSSKRPRALVLTPTRELAAQVNESFRIYGERLNLRSAVVFGGVGINPQVSTLRRGVDILVATPGRLLDLADRKAVDFRQLEALVLDEADRMLDMGFIHDIRRVLKLLPKERQNLLFSATYSEEIKRLSEGLLDNPMQIEVARRNTAAETVDQSVYWVKKSGKRALLSRLVSEGDWKQVLVFTRTKHGANRLAKQLAEDGVETAAIHGNKSQSARERALKAFKNRTIRVLVATDVAARGIDIDSLPHVVNYELPNVAEDYVHRIGRTGRAGKEGEAVSLVGEDEGKLLRGIERLLGRNIDVVEFEGCIPASDRGNQRSSASNIRKPRGSQQRRSSSRPPRKRVAESDGEGGRRNNSARPNNRRSNDTRTRRGPAPKKRAEASGESEKKPAGSRWKSMIGAIKERL
ncbi:DEAD/DEAH box helicase [Puniceicoccaceae bacterium K14]|nr:DEAD/DEAH box helicase [Puniceicoccaceae bacterium K14]